MKTPRLSPPNKRPRVRTIISRLRPNEIPERIADYKERRPAHTAEDWIKEAIYVSGQHCEDHDLEVSTFLYCALDVIKNSTENPNK
jgi:hypothetical protein